MLPQATNVVDMINNYDTYQAEIEYRSNRIRRDLRGRGARSRSLFRRRPVEQERTER